MRVSPNGITISYGGTRDVGGDSRPVVARIVGYADDARKGQIVRQMVVPAGRAVEEDLPFGLYNVELTLPSGRILQRNVRIDEQSDTFFRFFDDFGKPASFSLQESVSQPADIVLDRAIATNPRAPSPRDIFKSAPPGTALRSRNFVATPRGIEVQATSGVDAVGPPRATELAIGVGLVKNANVRMRSKAWFKLPPTEEKGDTALWRINPFAHSKPIEPSTRLWARTTLPSGIVEVASLPQPWFCVGSRRHVAPEILVNSGAATGASTRVAVKDEALSALLAFLDRGQAAAAGPVLESLEKDNLIDQTIYTKVSNPLAACAAAYVGLAAYPPGERERWDHWLNNLMEWFPGVPDGAIVHARRLMLRPGLREGNAHVVAALRQAMKAGPPFFSAGVRLQREMLAQLVPDFPQLKALAARAAQLAARVDEQQAFTVLRYAPNREKAR